MKVRISYTVEVDTRARRAIRHHYGEPGLATRHEVQRWYQQMGLQGDDDLLYDLDTAEPDNEQAAREG